MAQNERRPGGSAIDERTIRHAGYAISQQKRKHVEQSLGWMKMIGLLKKVKLRGLRNVSWWFTLVGAACNLIRLRRLERRRSHEHKDKRAIPKAPTEPLEPFASLRYRFLAAILTGSKLEMETKIIVESDLSTNG